MIALPVASASTGSGRLNSCPSGPVIPSDSILFSSYKIIKDAIKSFLLIEQIIKRLNIVAHSFWQLLARRSTNYCACSKSEMLRRLGSNPDAVSSALCVSLSKTPKVSEL